MKQRVEPKPSITEQVSPTAETKPRIATATTQDEDVPDFFDIEVPKTTAKSELESSCGVWFDVRSSSGGMSEHDGNLIRAAEKMKFIETSDSDEAIDVDVVKLQGRVIVLEKDSALKDAQILSLQAQVFNKDQTINQLQGDENLLMFVVFDLKAKLEKKFGREFADDHDDPMNVA
ncbi:hypothetical protein HanRHA438_Chr02g0061221 [Helianthus annuus]|nr:hypothetical protein HanIR_Chr02g0067201 [Helianthus annuus]KAJ0939446.1 hypothetical protein HanRHA438_Chr02g0061221 [Helianthus annuus]KAJ0951316.1 hypothetical protein HanPSC8_Chr02g0058561 [Helianthus annuus]